MLSACGPGAALLFWSIPSSAALILVAVQKYALNLTEADAGVCMQVWVITGDKQETAINIAISCRLINHPDRLHICNAHTPESAHSRLRELLLEVRARQNPAIHKAERDAAPSTAELVASAMPLPEGPSEPSSRSSIAFCH